MVKLINRDELVHLMRSEEDVTLIDVLDRDSCLNERIKGSLCIPLGEIDTKAPEVLSKDRTIIVYCANFDCTASTKAAQKLNSLGYNRVFDYKGGLKDYKKAGLPLEGAHFERGKECSTCEEC